MAEVPLLIHRVGLPGPVENASFHCPKTWAIVGALKVVPWMIQKLYLPSGYVKIAIENGTFILS